MKILEIIEDQIVNVDGYDHQSGDFEAAADWLGIPLERLHVEVMDEPVESFMKQIKEMYDTYKEFPSDVHRTKSILNKLKMGEPEYPIYVERKDYNKFIIEGRHRIIAFWLSGLATIPVAYVS